MIPIYGSEEKAGLSELIRNSNSIAFSSLVTVDINPDVKVVANANPDQIDLFYIESVLVSVGRNKNDDVFDKMWTWAARNTPVDKKFNFMHNEKDIIGHITSSRSCYDGKLILDDTKTEDLPDKFDIIVGSVLYKYWSDKTLQTRMDELIAGIKNNEWYVSMECLFSDFDYSAMDAQGVEKVIARTEESSFLTKHLKCYGGSGIYNEYKLGRLLKNFAFSGKGLVNNPANPKSIIINSSSTNVNASVDLIKEPSMSDKTVSLEEYNTLKDELKEVKASLKGTQDKEVSDHKTAIAKLDQDKKEVQTQLDNAQSLSTEKDVKIKDLEAKLVASTESITKINKELSDIKAEQVKASRVNKLLAVNVSKEKSDQLVSKFATASDEMFDEVVALHTKSGKKEEVKSEDKSKEIKTDIETAKADSAVNLGQEAEDKDKLVRASASTWIQENMLQKQEKK